MESSGEPELSGAELVTSVVAFNEGTAALLLAGYRRRRR